MKATPGPLYARNNLIPTQPPRRYSISAGKSVQDYWLLSDNGSFLKPGNETRGASPDYDVILHGPNGLYTHLRGLVAFPHQPRPEATILYDHATGDVRLSLTNSGTAPCTLHIVNAYAPAEPTRTIVVAPCENIANHWKLATSAHWFDLSITAKEQPIFLRRYAGHVETGHPSTSDPATFL